MTDFRKSTWLAVAALALGLAALPVSYSEAQSADATFSAHECEKLRNLVWNEMDAQQQNVAQECDMIEASHDWEQQYGGLSEQEMMAGVVYE